MKIYVISLIFMGLTSFAFAQQDSEAKVNGNSPRIIEKPAKISISYYPNGKMKRVTEIPARQNAKTELEYNIGDFSADYITEKRLFEGDSTGKIFVENGNGHFREIIESGLEQKIEEGDYKDGYKNGVWLGYYPNKDESFVETYANGKMLGGETTKNGKKYRYTIIRKCAEFPGGRIGWLSYISKSKTNPVYHNGQLVVGSVTPRFTIGKDGKIADVRVDNSTNKSLDLAAARILYDSPIWQPAKFRGIPFEYSYTEAINFKRL